MWPIASMRLEEQDSKVVHRFQPLQENSQLYITEHHVLFELN